MVPSRIPTWLDADVKKTQLLGQLLPPKRSFWEGFGVNNGLNVHSIYRHSHFTFLSSIWSELKQYVDLLSSTHLLGWFWAFHSQLFCRAALHLCRDGLLGILARHAPAEVAGHFVPIEFVKFTEKKCYGYKKNIFTESWNDLIILFLCLSVIYLKKWKANESLKMTKE